MVKLDIILPCEGGGPGATPGGGTISCRHSSTRRATLLHREGCGCESYCRYHFEFFDECLDSVLNDVLEALVTICVMRGTERDKIGWTVEQFNYHFRRTECSTRNRSAAADLGYNPGAMRSTLQCSAADEVAYVYSAGKPFVTL